MPTPAEDKNKAAANSASAEARKLLLGGVTGALLAAGAGAALLLLKFGLGLVHLSYDLPFAILPVVKPTEAVMVYLDDDSHEQLGQPRNQPWDRALHAKLLDRLTAAGARAVVFDIVFSDPGTNPEADAQLARAIRANGRVLLAADCVPPDTAPRACRRKCSCRRTPLSAKPPPTSGRTK